MGHCRQWSAFNIPEISFISYFDNGDLMKAITLKNNRDFQRIYKKGKSVVSPELVTYVMKNKYNNLRIGITTSKKIGKAVQRNRCRRIIRAAFSNLSLNLDAGFDIIFVARTKTGTLKSTDVERCMRKHLKATGVM